MRFINLNCNGLKSPELQAVIVEPILLSCIDGSTIDDLIYAIQKILSPSLSYNILKEYLFHLVNYELISYNGQKQIFIIESGGLDLLDWINEQKADMDIDNKDMTITIE